jgi:beta-glucosidase
MENLYSRDHVADTPKEAVRLAVMSGVDMSMVPLDYSFYNLTLQCIQDGSIPRTRLDDAVRRILRVKFALGKTIIFVRLILFSFLRFIRWKNCMA